MRPDLWCLVILFHLLLALTNVRTTQCDSEMYIWKQKCITFTYRELDWVQSHMACLHDNGNLLEVELPDNTQGDIKALLLALNASDIWMGERTQDSWYRSRPSSTGPLLHHVSLHPANLATSVNCVSLSPSTMISASCDQMKRFACEFNHKSTSADTSNLQKPNAESSEAVPETLVKCNHSLQRRRCALKPTASEKPTTAGNGTVTPATWGLTQTTPATFSLTTTLGMVSLLLSLTLLFIFLLGLLVFAHKRNQRRRISESSPRAADELQQVGNRLTIRRASVALQDVP